MFRGRFVHTIDAKGRVSIPAGFRVELQRRSDRAPILTNFPGCLALYPFEDWLEIEQELKAAATPLRPGAQAVLRFLISGATECPIDAQGRILVPPYLREHANLGREATIAGVGPRIEIWDKARLDADLARTEHGFGEMTAEMTKLGL